MEMMIINSYKKGDYEYEPRQANLCLRSKKIRNYQELIQSDPTSCPQNQKGNN